MEAFPWENTTSLEKRSSHFRNRDKFFPTKYALEFTAYQAGDILQGMSNIMPLSDAEILNHRDVALGQMRFTREYLLSLLDDVAAEQWNVIPSGSTSHIAWQVGHLAVAQYGLMLFRQRGRAEGDIELMPGWLRKHFGKGTQPSSDPTANPSRDELLSILDRIHQRSMKDAALYEASSLAEPADMPYAVFPMKLGALLFAPLHEAIHIGQIGVLRRMLGLAPVR